MGRLPLTRSGVSELSRRDSLAIKDVLESARIVCKQYGAVFPKMTFCAQRAGERVGVYRKLYRYQRIQTADAQLNCGRKPGIDNLNLSTKEKI